MGHFRPARQMPTSGKTCWCLRRRRRDAVGTPSRPPAARLLVASDAGAHSSRGTWAPAAAPGQDLDNGNCPCVHSAGWEIPRPGWDRPLLCVVPCVLVGNHLDGPLGWFQHQMPASPCARQTSDRTLGSLPATGGAPVRRRGPLQGKRFGAPGNRLVGNPCICLLHRSLSAPHPTPGGRSRAPPLARRARSSSR